MSLCRRGFIAGGKIKTVIESTKAAAIVLSFILFATACSKTDNYIDAGIKRFSISASNVDAAVVAFVAGHGNSNPAQVEATVHIQFSPNGTAAFTDFVLSHTNQPVTIGVDQYEDHVMFRGYFSNLLHKFDFHCASSNEAQRVAEILNKK